MVLRHESGRLYWRNKLKLYKVNSGVRDVARHNEAMKKHKHLYQAAASSYYRRMHVA